MFKITTADWAQPRNRSILTRPFFTVDSDMYLTCVPAMDSSQSRCDCTTYHGGFW